MRPFFILALLSLVGLGRSRSQTCPAQYKRFTPQHTFCIESNPMCKITQNGVSQEDIDFILRLHNQLRSKVAMGNEDRSRGSSMPQAADMMQMEWDYELAAIAQKWTENCYWGHDCIECRAVENFGVGQNIWRTRFPCIDYKCKGPTSEPDWNSAITGLYGEVVDYHRNWLEKFTDHPGPMTGHFTQLVWSRSWRVGCGYAFFLLGNAHQKYYVCNYGPAGNFHDQPLYKTGRPCTDCPTNTQCSTTERGVNSFPGLCKMDNPNTAPTFPRNQKGLLFYCAVSSNDPDCRVTRTGDGIWKRFSSVGGNYDSIVLNGGQSATLNYATPIVPKADRFCLVVTFRRGPLDASFWDESRLVANYKLQGSTSYPSYLDPINKSFVDYPLDLLWGKKTIFSLTFTVREGARQHVLDIRKIVAYDGACQK